MVAVPPASRTSRDGVLDAAAGSRRTYAGRPSPRNRSKASFTEATAPRLDHRARDVRPPEVFPPLKRSMSSTRRDAEGGQPPGDALRSLARAHAAALESGELSSVARVGRVDEVPEDVHLPRSRCAESSMPGTKRTPQRLGRGGAGAELRNRVVVGERPYRAPRLRRPARPPARPDTGRRWRWNGSGGRWRRPALS